jgi:hypothetical protein
MKIDLISVSFRLSAVASMAVLSLPQMYELREAKILEARVMPPSGLRGGANVSPLLRYQYSYEGRTYVTGSLTPMGMGSALPGTEDEQSLRALMASYTSNGQVNVYVNKVFPRATFVRFVYWEAFVYAAIHTALFLIPTALVVKLMRM